jgi:hypothetical protein
LFSNLLADVKAWFNRSWSIFLARLEVLTGVLVGVFGGLDWTALTQLDWSQGLKSPGTMIVAALLVIKGIVSEMGRRAGTVVAANDQLVPQNIAEAKKIPLKK